MSSSVPDEVMSAMAGMLQQLQVIEGATTAEEREVQYDMLASMLASSGVSALSGTPLGAAPQPPAETRLHETAGLTAATSTPLTGRLVIQGCCSDGLTHSLDARAAALRSRDRSPIYCGDWELRVVAVPRETLSFPEFVAEQHRDREQDEANEDENRAQYTSGSMCPADSLWELTNFGTLFWEGADGWVLPRGEQPYCKRIWAELDPRGGSMSVLEAREEAMQQLEAVPGSELPKNEALKMAHAARIKADFDLLDQLVAERGSIGGTVLPDALQPIIECHTVYSDGNYRTATFATANYCFSICMSTS